MAFHPYPRVIRKLFNVYRFGPPLPVTVPSTCPWVDHKVSRLPPLTKWPPCSDSLSLRLRKFTCLTLPGTVTRRLIMQKARRHHKNGSDRLQAYGFRFFSLRYARFFSPFPHGTVALSVSWSCLALPDGAGRFGRGVSDPALLRIDPSCRCRSDTGLSPPAVPLSRRILLWLCMIAGVLQPRRCLDSDGLGCSAFARRYLRNHYCFLFLRVLRCFSSPG